MSEDVDVTAADALQVAQRALAKFLEHDETIEELLETQADLEDKLLAMELRLSEYDDDRSYDQLTRDDKVGIVREKAFERAVDKGGRTALDYDDIQWIVFDGEPSADHCYTLMRLAAGYDEVTGESTVPGFRYRVPNTGNRHLAVDAKEARKHAVRFSSANKTTSAGGSR